MWQLHQFPLCPFSRKVRLLLSEKGVAYELCREFPWERREEFLRLNHIGRTPVLHFPERNFTLIDSRAICEYFEETVDRAAMINGTALNRAEIRRLVSLFDECFYAEVTAPLLRECMIKRLFLRQPPDSRAIHDAMRRADTYLDEIDDLIDHRPWIAGATMSLADLAAAAQISVVDYLGGFDWSGHEQTRGWYSVLKSRRSFQPLLIERMGIIQPPSHYPDVDG
jgi:glutathione S-transferase